MLRRVNVNALGQMIKGMSQKTLQRQNEADWEKATAEHEAFVEAYKRQFCYLCGKPFKTSSTANPCVHWILRQCKFKKKDFPLVYKRFGYRQIAAFARWVANEERFQGNINDLSQERSGRKVFQCTVKWKHIEWTFECSEGDYTGHTGTASDFPHYHFQMRIDKRPFIDFNDFHIPLSEEDLFYLDLDQGLPDLFEHTFGMGGAGMQTAAEMKPEVIVEESTVVDPEHAAFRLQTFIVAGEKPITSDALMAMYEESKTTGKTVAHLSQKYFNDARSIRTIVSPADSVPEIAKRTGRKSKATSSDNDEDL